jgi:hypothetical protein
MSVSVKVWPLGRGKENVSKDILDRLCKYLGVSPKTITVNKPNDENEKYVFCLIKRLCLFGIRKTKGSIKICT